MNGRPAQNNPWTFVSCRHSCRLNYKRLPLCGCLLEKALKFIFALDNGFSLRLLITTLRRKINWLGVNSAYLFTLFIDYLAKWSLVLPCEFILFLSALNILVSNVYILGSPNRLRIKAQVAASGSRFEEEIKIQSEPEIPFVSQFCSRFSPHSGPPVST